MSRRHNVLVGLTAFLIMTMLAVAATAAWLAGGGGEAHAKAASLDAGATPTATADGDDVAVAWAPTFLEGQRVDSYTVKRFDLAGVATTLVGCASAFSDGAVRCTDTNAPEGEWRYSVTPKYFRWTGAESARSDLVGVAPSAPSTLVATANGTAQIDLTWVDTSTSATSFDVYQSETGLSDSFALLGNVESESFAHTSLDCNTTRYYRVVAMGPGGDSAYSDVASATTAACLIAPSNLAVSPGQTSVNATWTDNSNNETGFALQRSTDSGATWTTINVAASSPATATGDTISHTDQPLACATAYRYRVRAVDSSGASAYTAPQDTTTLACGAPTVGVTSPANGDVISDTTPTFSGMASNNVGDANTVVVEVFSGPAATGTPVQTRNAPRVGETWTVDANPALTAGVYTVHAKLTGTAGTTTSTANTFTIVTAVPHVTVTAPGHGSFTRNQTPLVAGTAGNGPSDSATIQIAVYSGGTATGTPVRTFSATRSGTTWSASVPSALLAGEYTVQATQSNIFGTGSSNANTFTIDIVGPTVTITAPNAFTSDTTPAIAGTAGDALGDNSTVQVTVEDVPMTSTQNFTATRTGTTWTVDAATLENGKTYRANATQGDAAGNISATATRDFTVDTAPPATTDNTATIGNTWKGTTQTVTLSPTDAGSGVAATYYTIDGSTPTTSSSEGTSVVLPNTGEYTIKYFSVDNLGNAEAIKTAGTVVRLDKSAPDTTDNTASIGSAWRNTDANVVLTAGDAGRSGVAATYYTTDGSTPTTSSSQGTSIPLTATGVYTIRYFSVDNLGNAESVKTAGTQIRIDTTNPATPTFANPTPASNAALTGTPAFAISTPSDTGGSGVAGVQFEYRLKTNSGDAFPATWTAMGALVTASPWQSTLNTAQLDMAHLEVRVRSNDNAGNGSTSVTRSYTVRPQVRDVQMVNKSGGTLGRMEPGDQVVITYSQAMNTAACTNGHSGTATVSNNDRLEMATCSFGNVRLPDYASADITFASSGAAWTLSNTKLTITLGAVSDATKTKSSVAAAIPSIQVSSAFTSYAAIAMENNAVVQAPAASQF